MPDTPKTKGDKPKHTPGLWRAHLNAPFAIIPGHIIKTDDDVARPIALIPEGGGTHGKPAQIANAYVLAAAPELLRELERALPTLDDCEQENRARGGRWIAVADAFKRQTTIARGVIAKARGEHS